MTVGGILNFNVPDYSTSLPAAVVHCSCADVDRIYRLISSALSSDSKREVVRISPLYADVEDILETATASRSTVLFLAPVEAFDSAILDRLIRLLPPRVKGSEEENVQLVICVATSSSAMFSKLSQAALARLSVSFFQAPLPESTLNKCLTRLQEHELKPSGELLRSLRTAFLTMDCSSDELKKHLSIAIVEHCLAHDNWKRKVC